MADERPPNYRRLAIGVGAMVLTAIFSVFFGLICDLTFGHDVWTAYVLQRFGLIIGTPIAAALAFGIVITFQETSEGPLSIRLGPLELSGPACPVLLWVVCFLSVVFAIGYLSPAG